MSSRDELSKKERACRYGKPACRARAMVVPTPIWGSRLGHVKFCFSNLEHFVPTPGSVSRFKPCGARRAGHDALHPARADGRKTPVPCGIPPCLHV